MSLDFRYVLVTVLILSLLAPISVSAKGGFDYIAVTGPGLQEEIQITDEALTRDFFAFANFYENRTEAPAAPGPGYEITRYYLQGVGSVAFDQLHYYPETGLVYYDGIAGGGSSEYDGGWYTAEPEIKSAFESALSSSIKQVALSDQQGQGIPASSRTQWLTLVAVVASLAAVLIFASCLRKPSTH